MITKPSSSILHSIPKTSNNSAVFSILSDSLPFACAAPIIFPPFLIASITAAGVIKSLQSLKSNKLLFLSLIISIESFRKKDFSNLSFMNSTSCNSDRRILIGNRLISCGISTIFGTVNFSQLTIISSFASSISMPHFLAISNVNLL